MKGVAATSLWVAASRALESERPDALFHDPFARRLAGDEGFVIEEARRNANLARGGHPPSLEIRTRFLDDRIAAALERGPLQCVLFAAGMDARAYRLPWPPGTRLFELDQPSVLAYKEEKLAGVAPTCDRRALAIDLRDDFTPALEAGGFDRHAPAIFLVEGLLLYLHEPEVRTLFSRLDALAAPGSVALFDLLSRALLEAPFFQDRLEAMKQLDAPWHFGTDDPNELLGPLGWTVTATDFGEYGARFGRWPFPVAPIEIKGVPRSFLVEALKR